MVDTIKVLVKKVFGVGLRAETKTVGIIETDVPVKAISRGHSYWKKLVRNAVTTKNPGDKIHSINVLAVPVDGAHIVVTLTQIRKGLVPGKPVTRGGKPIGVPMVRKTMATLRRDNR